MSRRLIVEADGGSRGNPGPAAYGALVRDADTGEVLAEVAEAIGVATNNVAEYRGLMAGLAAAAGIDPDATVEARLDSKLVVEQMSGRWKVKNADLRPIVLEARSILPAEHVSYTWVPRAQNAAADRLVNLALDGKPIGGTAAHEAAGDASRRSATATRTPPAADVADAGPTAPGRRLIAWSPDLGTPTSLHLVRHGQTPMTVAKQFSGGGVDGPGLDDTGREQAAHTAERLVAAGIVAVIASPTLRTRQTAEIIAGRLGVSVRIDDGWRECEFGEWEGLTLEEIVERDPAELSAWHGSTSVPAPGGESLDQMSRRVAVARDKTIARFPGRPIVVVTHSMPVRALVRLALEASPAALFRLQPAPGSVTRIDAYNDGTQAVTSFGQRP